MPQWWFTKFQYSPALFQAIAGMFSQITQDADDQQQQTFILESTAPFLDLLGDERSKYRMSSEVDPLFAKRVQNITSATDYDAILASINALLIIPGAKIYQAPMDHIFCNRGAFCDRDQYLDSFALNFFLVVVPSQTHPPYSFTFNGEAATGLPAFANRDNFAGSVIQDTDIFPNIIQVINDQKALGMMYAIVESTNMVLV